MTTLRSFTLAIGVATCVASSTSSCAAQKLVWGSFDMPKADAGCFLETNATDLEHELWNFGWKAHGNNFPAIAWEKQRVAIVVPTLNEAMKPTSVGISRGQVIVHLSPTDKDYDGVVVEIPKSYARLKKCRLQYDESETAAQVYPMVVSAISLDSIVPDKPADPSRPRPAPLPDESHDLPATATMPGTEPPQ